MKQLFGVALIACFAFLFGTLNIQSPGKLANSVSLLGIETAEARPARRSARRTTRRTGRRVGRRAVRRGVYRRSVVGCPIRYGYYYCGGVYYRRVIDDGQTVYIVVNP